MQAHMFTSLGPETIALLARAYDNAVRDLGLPPKPVSDNDTSPHHEVARHLISLALQGERNGRRLHAATVAALRR
jgi:hypothetical protein